MGAPEWAGIVHGKYVCCISLRFVSLCYAVLFCALALIIVVQPF